MIRTDQATCPSQEHGAVVFADRLLAESVRALERDGAVAITEPQAEDTAAGAGCDFEHGVIVRARSLSVADELRKALRRSRQVLSWIVVIGLVLAAAAGAGAARAALADQPVNVFWALGGLLGIQTLLLLAWVVMMIKSPAALSGVSLGGAAVAVGRRLAGRWHKGAVNAAAIQATAGVVGRGPIGRWTFGSISHGVWLTFNAACLLLIVLMLSAKHYRFVWETTILTADTYSRLTQALAWAPSRLGIPTPSPEQIAASEGTLPPDTTEATRHAWSGLLVGSLVVYGFVPRFLLLGVCLVRLRLAKNRWRLDTTRPGYLRLQAQLMPQHERLGVVDDEMTECAAEAGEPGEASAARPARPAGPPAIVAVEIEPPGSPWPPRVGATSLSDLGFVDDRNDRTRVLEHLAASPTEPTALVVVGSLTTTPDRGIGSFLHQLQRAVGSPLSVVLTGGESLRRRGDASAEHVRRRVEDWRRLAGTVGLAADRVVELDLDHLTDVSAAKLAALLGAEVKTHAVRRIESAFDLIVDHLARWPDTPDAKQQAELHRAIGALYREEHSSWRTFLRAPVELKGELTAPLRAGAERVASLLPERLRGSPRWLAAGAAAGALGCITAATLVSPAAIAALPMWSALGAAIATATKALHPSSSERHDNASPQKAQRTDAVRAAALFALLLELQGRDEASITRILDRIVDADDTDEIGTAESACQWLDGIRHRLDVALAEETVP